MKVINLTPHDINILDARLKPVMVAKRSMKVARLDSHKVLLEDYKEAFPILGIKYSIPFPMYRTRYGEPYLVQINDTGKELERVQFPPNKIGIIYIVSGLFRSGFNRMDLWEPGELIRDENDKVIGCYGLSC